MKKYKNELTAISIFIAFNLIVLWYGSTLTGHGDGMALGIFLVVFDAIVFAITLAWVFYKMAKNGYIKTVITVVLILISLGLYYVKQNFSDNTYEDDLITILKTTGIEIKDDFTIERVQTDTNGGICEFGVRISEKDHQHIVEQMKNISEVQKDSSRYILDNREGYKIIVDEYTKSWLGIFGCSQTKHTNF